MPKEPTEPKPRSKRGFSISVDTDTIRTASKVAKKVFKRKKKSRDLTRD